MTMTPTRRRTRRASVTRYLLVLLLSIKRCHCQPGIGERFLPIQNGVEQHQNNQDFNNGGASTNSTMTSSSTASTSNNNHPHDATEVSSKDFFSVFGKLGTNWHTILQMFRTTIGSAGGETYHHDVFVTTLEEGVEWLYGSTIAKKNEDDGDDEVDDDYDEDDHPHNDWKALLQPYEEIYKDFDMSIDDILKAFLRWSLADEAPDITTKSSTNMNDDSNKTTKYFKKYFPSRSSSSSTDLSSSSSPSSSQVSCHLKGGINGQHRTINVSKAERRLERYIHWMENLTKDLDFNNGGGKLTAVSMLPSLEIFDMKITNDDCSRLVWWLNLGNVNWSKWDTLSPNDIKRLFVWISHYMLFDNNAQTHGMVFINALNQMGIWSFMTMLPFELGMALDEFIISVIPLKTKYVVLLERPPWAKFAYQLLKPFMKSEMRSRVGVIETGLYPPEYLYDVVGTSEDVIPVGQGEHYPGSDQADILKAYLDEKVLQKANSENNKKNDNNNSKGSSTWKKSLWF